MDGGIVEPGDRIRYLMVTRNVGKQAVAELTLDKLILKEAAEGNW